MLQRITSVKARPHNSSVHHVNPYRTEHPRELIRRLLRERGFHSPRALAIAANVSQPALSRYLAGTSENMEMSTWQALAATLGVTVGELLGEVPLSKDPAARAVLRAMEKLPPAQKAALVAAATAMADKASDTSPAT